jgi:hypothetical protein
MSFSLYILNGKRFDGACGSVKCAGDVISTLSPMALAYFGRGSRTKGQADNQQGIYTLPFPWMVVSGIHSLLSANGKGKEVIVDAPACPHCCHQRRY